LLALWDTYVKENGIILTNDGMFAKGQEEETIDDTIGDQEKRFGEVRRKKSTITL
jgi:hypothetical protein